MSVFRALAPLAAIIAVVGVVILFLLDQDVFVGPWLLAFLIFGHGWVHLMFVFPKPERGRTYSGTSEYPFDFGRSWLVRRAGIEAGVVRSGGTVLMAAVFAVLVLAALATIGVVVPADPWAGLVIVGALGSTLFLALFFSPALLLGFPINAALLWLALSGTWSPA